MTINIILISPCNRSSNKFIFLGCIEDENWRSQLQNVQYQPRSCEDHWPGLKCADYGYFGYCKQGGVGREWDKSKPWPTGLDPEDGDARDVCCVCGGRGAGNLAS